MTNRKSIADLHAQFGETMHALQELGKQEAMTDAEYVRRCISYVPPLAAYMNDYTPDQKHRALKLASINNRELWLSINGGKIILTDIQLNYAKNIETPISLEKVMELYKPVITQCGEVISKFLKEALAAINAKRESFPTTEELIKKRREHFAQLAKDAKRAAAEYERLADQ